MKCRLALLIIVLATIEVATQGAFAQANISIEGLAPPKPAPIPRPEQPDERSDGETELQEKRRERRKREKSLAPEPVSMAKMQEESLRRDTLQPRPHWFLLEVSLVGGGVVTKGSRESYKMDPTSHFGLFFRGGAPAVDGKAGIWYGLRVAPFSGTGFYKKVPGTYGLTYFGPMIGIGKIDPVPVDDGTTKPNAADGESHDDLAVGGWLISTGIAGVTKAGKQDGIIEDEETNDFATKGAVIDAPGLWIEARYLRILYGGLGFDVLVGTQTGRGKAFYYAGIAAAGWY